MIGCVVILMNTDKMSWCYSHLSHIHQLLSVIAVSATGCSKVLYHLHFCPFLGITEGYHSVPLSISKQSIILIQGHILGLIVYKELHYNFKRKIEGKM